MKQIRIPGKGPVRIYGDGMFVSVPGDGPVNSCKSRPAAGGYVGTAMQFENGDVMLFEDGTVMIYE